MERVDTEGGTPSFLLQLIQGLGRQDLVTQGPRVEEPASLDGRPGDRVNLSCGGVSHPIRWVWAPSFPACKGLSKGRRPILWASSSGTPTVPPLQPFVGRLRSLDSGIRRLELLLSAGDSGTFFCKGRHEDESRTVLHVLGDRTYCKAPGPTHGSVYPQLLIPLLGAGLVLGLGALGLVWWLHRRLPPQPIRPLPRFALSPPHSSTCENRAPEASKGGRAQDSRGPGPGTEPALCGSGPSSPQQAPPAVHSGPC
ncbi:megakaryocyte and platelet inhibitory receptor G6b isoform X26 [Homo sapiens]|uniref:megakaryocyte and platelet inhibitory receptor G6b isoform X4 n=1 Tax=Homo sapiens TaxID=9606 RepID=UPI0005D03E2A|nr:megakaryocyte and platelet inhibitory receptor G6b isoform X4 [Homo sapiens]XP_054186384.1 megakaryocyte and platelet inhibitory receptor G6b isoform X9 [Homo sapiens]XP_054186877.1 megakaryocyte and platelet inhibitory receptor G6b isoform X14 [Homo sapiens]XP_054187397.1 megakaryocyte and platelet inhibitory receptor G6b isoform X21 [Homo sapiens]XP_054212450.1 megakaryocyte and platelet inhibitory receptor G6b isoform X26 [Homo sapiens]|eukprot:XP_011513223.1 megakaryocyte and platelet inhibitory receptor G6b isoform X3 [Homo sapiens]